MACYDKKLEATRKEFECKIIFMSKVYNDIIDNDVKDVDIVLTSSEILEMLNQIENSNNIQEDHKFSTILQNIDKLQNTQAFLSIDEMILSKLKGIKKENNQEQQQNIYIHSLYKPTSNSYSEAIIEVFVKKELRETMENVKINYKQGKNSDIEVYNK